MKNIIYSFFTVLFVFFANISDSFSQQINAKITEVYGNKTQEIFQNDPERIAFLTDLLDNRIKFIELPVVGEDKHTKLSSVALLNKYNSSLLRDIVFDPLNFNPLKYDFNISSKSTVVYRVDNTKYLIVIQPQTLNKD